MNKITFKISLLFAPLAYAAHHFEEMIIFNFREWRSLYFADSNPLSSEAVFVILTAITLIYIILHYIFENRATAMSIILFFMATQVNNILFHAGGTLVFGHFSPGLITALLLYLPVNVIICMKALKEGWVSPVSLVILFVAGGALFWLFEQFGPFPMIGFLTATYIWTGVEAVRHTRLQSQRDN